MCCRTQKKRCVSCLIVHTFQRAHLPCSVCWKIALCDIVNYLAFFYVYVYVYICVFMCLYAWNVCVYANGGIVCSFFHSFSIFSRVNLSSVLTAGGSTLPMELTFSELELCAGDSQIHPTPS